MDLEMDGPIDDLEALLADEDEELLGDAEPPTHNPQLC